MDLPSILAIIGGIALLVGILGGGVEAKEIKIPSISRQARNLSTASGIVLIGISIFTFLYKPPPPLEATTPTPTISGTNTATQPLTITPINTTQPVTGTPTLLSLEPTTALSPSTWELAYKSPILARQGMAAVYDSYRHVIVMFGGVGKSGSNAGVSLAETWEFDGNSWYLVNTATIPPPRKWFGMAYDSQRKVVVMFGGQNNLIAIDEWKNLNDMWGYDGKNWKLIQPTNSPPPLSQFGMVYDSCRQSVVLFGGKSDNGFSRSTWEYNGNTWEEANTFVSPSIRSLFPMVFDSNQCLTVLFGGGNDSLVPMNDTWEYDGKIWEQRNTNVTPIPRWGHSMAFNPINKKILLFGGYGPKYPEGNKLQDTWEFDGTEWIELKPIESPTNREQTILAFDGNNNLIILFGGDANGETWKFIEK